LPAHSQSQQLSAFITPAGPQGELYSNQKKKNRRKKRKSRTKNDEAEYDDVIIPGSPGTPYCGNERLGSSVTLWYLVSFIVCT
jgi:hypothetical protein